MMDARFKDKVAIITGGAGGIGGAIARRLSMEGARVVLADRAVDLARTKAEAIAHETGVPAVGQACDVSDDGQVEACVRRTLDHFGRFDVMVNNAGLMTFKPLSQWIAEDWLRVMRVDLLGAAAFTKQVFLHAPASGASIVNISSIHAVMTSPDAAPYAAAKAALLSLTRTASIEGRPRKIRANAILPGAIDTPMLWNNPNVKSGAETIHRSDIGRPEDIAAAVAFFASEDAAFVTGASLPVDGGRLAQL